MAHANDAGRAVNGAAAGAAKQRPGLSRRQFLAAAGAIALGGSATAGAMFLRRNEGGRRASVFIGRAASYDADLRSVVLAGLRELGVSRERVCGKRVLLKPNLVETARGVAHINTHPMLLIAAVEAFRSLDAADVVVAEGQGHRRDSWIVLEESGTLAAIDDIGARFVDLNHDMVERVPNRGGFTTLRELYLPRTLLGADWVVSLPKLKTHHWAGVTCSMKNFFGVMPGLVYGWPKNVLHWHGIPESILDINATVRPHLAIVDGIVGMEGDGPIMGAPRSVGAIVMGENLPAVDATCTRLMGLNPAGVAYLRHASARFGPIRSANIEQRGESIAALRQHFAVLDKPHLRAIALPEQTW